MTIAFVLGNGVSRLAIDPDDIKSSGSIYACNAIYRDFIPNYLIAVDNKMVIELVENKIHTKTEVWSNSSTQYIRHEGINYFNPVLGWSSGPSALWLASQHNHSEIYILGFDYQGIKNNTKFNNVYAGTLNYKKQHEPPTYYGNWLKQTEITIKSFPYITYYRVINEHQYNPRWAMPNLHHIDYQTFKSKLNIKNDNFDPILT